MSQYSELIGSFVRTSDFPIEADYVFDTEEQLLQYQNENQLLLHEGLLKIVRNNGNQTLYWAVKRGDNYEFEKVVTGGSSTPDPELANKVSNQEELIKAIVGTNNDGIKEYLQTLSYKSLTEISEAITNIKNNEGISWADLDNVKEELTTNINTVSNDSLERDKSISQQAVAQINAITSELETIHTHISNIDSLNTTQDSKIQNLETSFQTLYEEHNEDHDSIVANAASIQQLSTQISNLVGFNTKVVTTLPTAGEKGTIYLVLDTDNQYKEYIWIDELSKYEMLGILNGNILVDNTVTSESNNPVSSKAIYNYVKDNTPIVDQTYISGSTNAICANAVLQLLYDEEYNPVSDIGYDYGNRPITSDALARFRDEVVEEISNRLTTAEGSITELQNRVVTQSAGAVSSSALASSGSIIRGFTSAIYQCLKTGSKVVYITIDGKQVYLTPAEITDTYAIATGLYYDDNSIREVKANINIVTDQIQYTSTLISVRQANAVVKITQADYDALPTKDPNIIYAIVPNI